MDAEVRHALAPGDLPQERRDGMPRPGRPAAAAARPAREASIASTCSSGIVSRSSSSSSEIPRPKRSRAPSRWRGSRCRSPSTRGSDRTRSATSGRDGRGGLAVVAEEVADRLVGDVRPPLGVDHVPDRLGRDELRDGRDDDRVAHLGAHAADLLERGVEQLGPTQLLEHPPRRRDHSAGELVVVVRRVELLRRPDRQSLLAPERAEVVGHLGERVEVEPVREALGLEVAQCRLGGGFDVPRASGATAVCSTWNPARRPSM